MTFKEKVNKAQLEISTKAFIEYSMVAKLVKSYGLENVLKAVSTMPLKHKNPAGYIIKCCSGKSSTQTINVDIFNKCII